MNVLLIPDKFKGSLSAAEVIKAIKQGLSHSKLSINCQEILASDGGDGFLEAIAQFEAIRLAKTETVNPLGQKITANYVYHVHNKTAYIELAQASGLALLKPEKFNVLKASTYGSGLQIKTAIENGATQIYIGLGGSASNDAGMGIASALGYNFLDVNGNILEPCGKNLIKIHQINEPQTSLKHIKFTAVNDVKNVLFGTQGAAFVYAGQKGATLSDIKLLDQGLKHLNQKIIEYYHKDYSKIEGAGAAGGTAFGLKAFFNADFVSGIDFILEQHQSFRSLNMQNIDLIITGEGKLDRQTLYGKLINGVCKWAQLYQIPVVAICGINTLSQKEIAMLNLLKVIEISDTSKNLNYNLTHASTLIERAIFNFIKHFHQ